ncbi:unnamed protein product [Zymoseptoria tritici ST99CH_3D7]|uniref:Methyltransferase domain-containing protein n=1 Tax=Zymoseptoria tritici (strain ST99CH_3D7) TaxID=1276538 RepID=A0A1X7RSC0_ZYMT9|nr:unnamed protein product [Zymoseptoria tritici ST99CH_3D7]
MLSRCLSKSLRVRGIRGLPKVADNYDLIYTAKLPPVDSFNPLPTRALSTTITTNMSSSSSSSTQTKKKDHWSSESYASSAAFVPQLTSTVLSYLNPTPSSTILDIGCGDGLLTTQIARSAHSVLGIDASESFIASANQRLQTSSSSEEEGKALQGKCTFSLCDANSLLSSPSVQEQVEKHGGFDKVFSNAAMHWILRHPSTRDPFFTSIHRVLKPRGTFTFEMGGAGNVAEILTATTAALRSIGGLSLFEAREASPWFFPSVAWMRACLERNGFVVEICETEYRPSRMTETEKGGLEGWVRLMCAEFLERVEDEGKKEECVRAICENVEGSVWREEDGSRWLGYVRLRAVARKK